MPYYTENMKNRIQLRELSEKVKSSLGRIIILTGARQTGKTTLAKKCFGGYTYLSIEDPVLRIQYKALTAGQWSNTYPYAILDEVQKEPTLIESIKSVYDQFPDTGYILLGSSQILLMKKIKESLAGRCYIAEIFPLTIPELISESWDDEIKEPVFVNFIKNGIDNNSLPVSFSMLPDFPLRQRKFEHFLAYGGYPAVSEDALEVEERYDWLTNYVKTYLERDIRDLASINDLEPFIRIQQMLALQTGQLINFSSLAKDAGVSIKTSQRYVQYLTLSYQAFELPPWSKNKLKRLVKSPKIHILDPGILRTILNKRGEFTGNEFESAVIAELYKQIKLFHLRLVPFHLRTLDGREIDLLLEGESGYYAIEIKKTNNISKSDAKNIFKLEEILDKPLIYSFVLSNDPIIKMLGDKILAIPVAMFLS